MTRPSSLAANLICGVEQVPKLAPPVEAAALVAAGAAALVEVAPTATEEALATAEDEAPATAEDAGSVAPGTAAELVASPAGSAASLPSAVTVNYKEGSAKTAETGREKTHVDRIIADTVLSNGHEPARRYEHRLA